MNTRDLLLRRRMMMEGRSPLPPPPDYRTVPLTFEILSDGNILWAHSDTAQTIEYSKNGGEWTSITATADGAEIPVVTGDNLRFRGTAWPGPVSCQFASTCQFSVKGNPSSIKYGDVLTGNEALEEECFVSLFAECEGLTSAADLALPATTLAGSCYDSMFYGCTSLTAVPELPGATLAFRCYAFMFSGCASLTTTPELPATTLEEECYLEMFSGCESLTAAPELPATTLAPACYEYMFKGCASLTTTPELPATTLEEECYDAMFSGCTSLEVAPELPATTLALSCYAEMFSDCTNLSEVKCYAEDISAQSCVDDWLDGVSATGTFTKKAGVNWPSGASGIPSGWSVVEV